MKGKVALVIGAAVGYVFGTRAGNERYKQIKARANSLWQDPRVQEKATQAQDLAKEQAPRLQDKVVGAAHNATAKAKDKTMGGEHPERATTVGEFSFHDPAKGGVNG